MSFYDLLLGLHIAAGSAALLGFWAAGLARKGSPFHRRVGRVYLLAMLVVVGTSLPMAIIHLAAGRIGIGAFLAYLVVITATAMWLSWRAIQLKRSAAVFYSRRYAVVAAVNMLSGIVVFALGVDRGQPLLMGFSWVGIILGFNMLRRLRAVRRVPPTGNWWLREHYGAMLGNGVATHIAFLSIGMRPVLQAFESPLVMMLPWMLPLLVAGIAGLWLDRRYGRPRNATSITAGASATLPS
jgi:hypothetical protein